MTTPGDDHSGGRDTRAALPCAGCAVLLPAAGASTRMRGRDKLLEPVDGAPLLRRQAARALVTGAAVLVTLRPADHARRAALSGLAVATRPVPDAAEGMAASLRAGAAWAGETGARALMILLPDMPGITTADIGALCAAWAADPGTPLRAATATGTPGHPVILPRTLFPALRALSGDQGARPLLPATTRHHPLPDDRAVTDLDTPEAWAAWRARNPTP
ncbi:MAG: nucleotidyltransferase family protein [Rhodobacteraceae bacterium]|nr:nucleotidyltransferase family protein [Paracoccaceae bacterium]